MITSSDIIAFSRTTKYILKVNLNVETKRELGANRLLLIRFFLFHTRPRCQLGVMGRVIWLVQVSCFFLLCIMVWLYRISDDFKDVFGYYKVSQKERIWLCFNIALIELLVICYWYNLPNSRTVIHTFSNYLA